MLNFRWIRSESATGQKLTIAMPFSMSAMGHKQTIQLRLPIALVYSLISSGRRLTSRE